MEWHLDKEILDFGLTDDNLIVIDWNDGRRSVFDPHPYLIRNMERLLDRSYFEAAYMLGHGRGIAWPGNRDFGAGFLYEESRTVDDVSTPLPPRGSCMTWNPERRIASVKVQPQEGMLAVLWNDGTTRLFSTWEHASNDTIEKFVDAAYLAQARITLEREAIEWPDGERFEAKTLYERSAIIGMDRATGNDALNAERNE